MAILKLVKPASLRSLSIRIFADGGPFETLWNSANIGFPLWCLGIAFSVRWAFFHIPPPGYAIGALAVVAGLMSVRQMSVLGKIGWVLLLLCMLFAEAKAINADHAENEKKQREFFEEQQKDFSEVTKQATTNFASTTTSLTTAINGLKEVLQTTKGVATAVNKNLENVTGGKAFAYAIPGTGIPPDYYKVSVLTFSMSICNGGNAILSGLKVAIAHVVREAASNEAQMTDNGLNTIIQAGSLAARACSLLPGYYMNPHRDDPGGHPHYVVTLEAQNGTTIEQLYLRPGVRGSWAYRVEILTPDKRRIKEDWVEPKNIH